MAAGLSRFMRVAASASIETTRCLGLLRPRSYGSAAAVQLDEDDDYDFFEFNRNSHFPMVDSQGSVPRRGIQWVIMGNPLAKKHVYVERLSKLLHVPHISMGTLVCQELHPSSSLYKQIANAVNQGKLVPEDIIFGLLSNRLQEVHYRGENGFILDEIPRNRVQAEILDQITDINLVVNFKCREKLLAYAEQVLLYAAVAFLLIFPFDIFYLSSRYFLLRTFWRIVFPLQSLFDELFEFNPNITPNPILNEAWIRVWVKKGGMIVLPAGIYHRFTLDTDNYIKAMRLFIGDPIWTPYNRPHDHLPARKQYTEAFLEAKAAVNVAA